MSKKLYYQLTNDGYHIFDENDPLFHIHQYEPFIPDPTKSYEENAIAQIEELMREPEEPNPYGVPDDIVEQIKNDAITEVEEAVLSGAYK